MKKIFQIIVSAFFLSWVVMPTWAATGHHESAKVTTEAAPTDKVVNLNTATVEQLTKLKGVGAKRAQEIINYRETHGKFSSVNDLAKVKGFSAKRVENLVRANEGLIEVK